MKVLREIRSIKKVVATRFKFDQFEWKRLKLENKSCIDLDESAEEKFVGKNDINLPPLRRSNAIRSRVPSLIEDHRSYQRRFRSWFESRIES